MGIWEKRVIESVARTVGARVIDPHDIPLLGPLAVERALWDGRIIIGNIFPGSLSPDLETSDLRFTGIDDQKRIRSLIGRLMSKGESFITRTRDGSVLWTINVPSLRA
ncbi:hypothetical protein KJ733_01555 [Patescibacteria group bacterium]|nr:hypothetical protein [Patescibacteria group bacterium]MBU1951580.1 hypothetical protein [Patescibacteria group bacterium]MBU2229255.1 hypothetical protein [Patescibacteria group bacterium]